MLIGNFLILIPVQLLAACGGSTFSESKRMMFEEEKPFWFVPFASYQGTTSQPAEKLAAVKKSEGYGLQPVH
jgi:hypothetical protein